MAVELCAAASESNAVVGPPYGIAVARPFGGWAAAGLRVDARGGLGGYQMGARTGSGYRWGGVGLRHGERRLVGWRRWLEDRAAAHLVAGLGAGRRRKQEQHGDTGEERGRALFNGINKLQINELGLTRNLNLWFPSLHVRRVVLLQCN